MNEDQSENQEKINGRKVEPDIINDISTRNQFKKIPNERKRNNTQNSQLNRMERK